MSWRRVWTLYSGGLAQFGKSRVCKSAVQQWLVVRQLQLQPTGQHHRPAPLLGAFAF